MSDDPFADLIQEQLALDRRLSITEVKETPIYASGTYAPTYLGQAVAGATTYTIQEGSWVRIGRKVQVWGRVAWSAATGTGAAIISIPKTAIFTRVTRFPVLIYPVNLTFANGSVVGVIDSATSAVYFVMNSPATNAAGTAVAVEAAGDLSFSTEYEMA